MFFKRIIWLIFNKVILDVTSNILRICDTPAEMLASRDPADACVEEAWQTVGGKGAGIWNQLERNFKKKL
ncbi:hypothetical protein [Peribacillus frigoritolerans]|uniref:hypothetical protein n=1 Tax=Peribacillus frigoritolerans TaxID=450367 RepID=UPI0007BEBAEB